MNGNLYLNQLACLKFRIFHMLLEICKSKGTIWCFQFPSTCSFRMFSPKFARNALVWLPVISAFSFDWFWIIVLHCQWVWRRSHVCDVYSVSVANNFFHSQSSADYGYYAFGEVAHFVDCLLQKTKQCSVLPLVEQWEEYMAPNHSKFAAIEDRFPAGTRLLSALEKVGRSYVKKEFRRDCRKFLEDFVKCVLSTVAAKSAIGQWLDCFCPPNLVGGGDHTPMQLAQR